MNAAARTLRGIQNLFNLDIAAGDEMDSFMSYMSALQREGKQTKCMKTRNTIHKNQIKLIVRRFIAAAK